NDELVYTPASNTHERRIKPPLSQRLGLSEDPFRNRYARSSRPEQNAAREYRMTFHLAVGGLRRGRMLSTRVFPVRNSSFNSVFSITRIANILSPSHRSRERLRRPVFRIVPLSFVTCPLIAARHPRF